VTTILIMSTIPLADARARLSTVLDEVRDSHERVVITRNGRPEAVILAASDLEALEETLDILATPGAVEQIRQAEDEISRGEAINAEELDRILVERRQREQAVPRAASRSSANRAHTAGHGVAPVRVNGTYGYDRESFLNEFFPDPADRQEVEADAERLVATNRAYRLAEMRRRLGLTQADIADRMHVRQERVSAIERAKIDAGELRTLAAYVKALGGRLEIVADFGGERLVIG
jgi:prevent-host-death family protein